MSQSNIGIGVEVVFSSAKAQAGLKSYEEQIAAFTQRLTRQSVEVPVKFDFGEASAAADEFTRRISSEAVKIPVALDTRLAEAMFDNLVSSMTSRAIQVPINFVPMGGMPTPGAFTVAGSGGGGTLTAMAASPASAAAPSIAAPAAAAGMFAAGTTFGFIRGNNYYPPAPMAPTPGGFGSFPANSTSYFPVNATAVPVPYANTAAGSLAAAAANTAGGTGAGAGGFFSGAFSRRGAMGAMMAIHGLNSMTEAIQQMSPDRFNSMSDPLEQLRDYRSAQQQSSAGIRGLANDYVYAPLAATGFAKRHPWGAMAINPLLYMTRNAKDSGDESAILDQAEFDAKRSDAKLRRKKQEGAAVEGLGEQLDSLRESDSGNGSSTAKAKAALESALVRGIDAVDKKLKEIMPQDAKLAGEATAKVNEIKTHLRNIHDAAIDQLNAAIAADTAAMGGEGVGLAFKLAGNGRGARAADLEQKITARQAALDKEGGPQGLLYRLLVAPLQRASLKQDEATREKSDAFASESSVRGYRTAESAAALSYSHRDDEAGRLSANAALDERLARLKSAVDLEKDVTKQKQLQAEYDAAVPATEAQKQLNNQRAAERRSLTFQGMGLSAEQANLRAQGKGDLATERGIRGETMMAFAQHAGDPAMQAAILRGGMGQLNEFMHGQDHPQVFNSWSGYLSHVQGSILDKDPNAMEEAKKTYAEFGKAIGKFDTTVDKLAQIPALTVIQ